MKKLITIIALLIAGQIAVSAKGFDNVFKKFINVDGVEYANDVTFKIEPFESARLTFDKLDIDLPFTMEMEINGLKTLKFENCDEADRKKIEEAIMTAGEKCELILKASGNNEEICVWLVPKKAKVYRKIVIFNKQQGLGELTGKFKIK